MKARKPADLLVPRYRDSVAWCEVSKSGGRRIYVGLYDTTPADATHLAAWLTKAAAWCREDGK